MLYSHSKNSMDLTSLTRPQSYKIARRVGRGGKRGKTSGRGGKGQTARAGNKRRPEWRDTIKRIPKRRGYGVNRSRTVRPLVSTSVLTLARLASRFENNDTVSIQALVEKGLVRRVSGRIPPLKILARGAIDKKLTIVKGILLSKKAKDAVIQAGGTVA